MPYPAIFPSEIKKIKLFLDKRKLREVITIRQNLQEMDKGILYSNQMNDRSHYENMDNFEERAHRI